MADTVTIPKKEYESLKKKAKLAEKLSKHIPESIGTYLASEKSLKKDWGYKGDDVWNEL